jgi:hypothetical protein
MKYALTKKGVTKCLLLIPTPNATANSNHKTNPAIDNDPPHELLPAEKSSGN